MEEFFCDSVGFRIGGMSFVHAFSMYLRMQGREQFHVSKDRLRFREHLITWLRVRVLAEHLRHTEFINDAEQLEKSWAQIVRGLRIREEYYGYFDDTFLPLIQQTINDTLIESDPRGFTEEDTNVNKPISKQSTPVHVLNCAWAKLQANPGTYGNWQEKVLKEVDWSIFV